MLLYLLVYCFLPEVSSWSRCSFLCHYNYFRSPYRSVLPHLPQLYESKVLKYINKTLKNTILAHNTNINNTYGKINYIATNILRKKNSRIVIYIKLPKGRMYFTFLSFRNDLILFITNRRKVLHNFHRRFWNSFANF